VRYLKIECTDHESERMAALLELPFPDGHVSFAIWRLLQEIVGAEVRGDRPSSAPDAAPGEMSATLAYPVSKWAKRLNCDEATVKDCFKRFAKLGLIEVTIDRDELKRTRVRIVEMSRYADEWAKRQSRSKDEEGRKESRNSGATREQLRRNSGSRKKASSLPTGEREALKDDERAGDAAASPLPARAGGAAAAAAPARLKSLNDDDYARIVAIQENLDRAGRGVIDNHVLGWLQNLSYTLEKDGARWRVVTQKESEAIRHAAAWNEKLERVARVRRLVESEEDGIRSLFPGLQDALNRSAAPVHETIAPHYLAKIHEAGYTIDVQLREIVRPDDADERLAARRTAAHPYARAREERPS
jgi:DNA-binding MarR family transcriptional regulator